MTLIDFGLSQSPTAPTRQRLSVVQTAPVVVEEVILKPSVAAGYVMKSDESWGWQELRDYVIREIERRHGPQVRNPKTESSIFKSFITRWPDQAVAIAKTAFEVHNGMWRNAPISVNRFCKASDEYFAAVIAKNL